MHYEQVSMKFLLHIHGKHLYIQIYIKLHI